MVSQHFPVLTGLFSSLSLDNGGAILLFCGSSFFFCDYNFFPPLKNKKILSVIVLHIFIAAENGLKNVNVILIIK